MGNGTGATPLSWASPAVPSAGQFSVPVQASIPEPRSRIDLTMSDNDDDATPSSGHCCPNSTQKIKLEPGATDLPLPAKAQPMFVDLTISNSDEDCLPITLSRKRCRSLWSPFTASESSDGSDVEHTWPTDFYVVDLVKGFGKCLKAFRSHKSVEEAFFKCFSVPFKSSTFYWHHRKWERASEACQEAGLCAGCTSAGLWSAFIVWNEACGQRKWVKA
jgi:hypothetical protein